MPRAIVACKSYTVSYLRLWPLTVIIAHWFKWTRSTAFRIMPSTLSIGGTVFPATFRNLNATLRNKLNNLLLTQWANNRNESMHRFKWSTRIIAFVLFFALGIINLVCDVVVCTR